MRTLTTLAATLILAAPLVLADRPARTLPPELCSEPFVSIEPDWDNLAPPLRAMLEGEGDGAEASDCGGGSCSRSCAGGSCTTTCNADRKPSCGCIGAMPVCFCEKC